MTFPKRLTQFLLVLALLLISGFLIVNTNTATADSGDGTIVVANRASGNLTLIDVATDTATTLAMPAGANTAEPMYVVHSRGKVFVGDRANNRVVVFDADGFSLIGEVAAGDGVFHMWADPNGKQLWVNNDIDNTITVIDVRNLSVLATVDIPADLVADGGKPHDVILDKKAAYVTVLGLAGSTDAVVKFSLRTFAEEARADVGKDPHVTLAPNRKTLFVAAQNSSEVKILNRRDLSEIATLTVPGAHGIDITRNGRVVYTTNISGGGMDALYTIDARNYTLIGSPVDTPFAVPHNIVLTSDNDKLYVTHSGPTANQVTVFSVSNNNPEPVLVGKVTTGFNPFGIEYVP